MGYGACECDDPNCGLEHPGGEIADSASERDENTESGEDNPAAVTSSSQTLEADTNKAPSPDDVVAAEGPLASSKEQQGGDASIADSTGLDSAEGSTQSGADRSVLMM